jgi:N-acetylglucosaminyl-diphospho-decaprenol L-rhamnosyltransferase
MDLSIIIINWNTKEFVRGCLASIRDHAGVLEYEVLVVDNASYDGCEQMVKAEFPQAVFIQSNLNVGFAKANNLAFVQSRGRCVLFLNPDTEVQEGALQQLVTSLNAIPTAGMVGARLLNSDLSLQTTCITALPCILNQALSSDPLRKAFPRWNIWGMRPLFDGVKNPVQVEAISGACMMAKREVIEQLGGFSTDYFMYSEDMDLCLKVAKCGWQIYYVPAAMIVHHAGGSSSSRQESNFSSIMLRQSVFRFMELHRGQSYAAGYRYSMAFVATCRILLLILALPVAALSTWRWSLSRALSKWYDILLWSLGFTQWATDQKLPVRTVSQARTAPELE